MFDRDGKLTRRTFAGVYNPGTSLSVAADDVSSVTVSVDGKYKCKRRQWPWLFWTERYKAWQCAMLIDHAVLFKDVTAVQQWGTDNGQDGYCISAFDDSKHFPDYIEACKASREFVVTEAQPPAILTPWTFQLYTDHPRASHYQGTNDPVTVYMYSEDKLVYAETFAGVHNPGVSVTANSASDITRVQVANDGGDDIFIDWATLSKDGGVVKQWGTDNGMDGYCVSTEERDGFLRTDGTDYLLGGWNCDPKVDFWVNAPDWEFELFTEHPTIDSATETTIGDIKIEMLDSNGKLVKARKFFGVNNPGTSLSVNAPDVTSVKVSVDGEYKCKRRWFSTRLDKTWRCAMLIDHAALLKDGNTVQQWGTDNGQDGYCISALSDGDNKYFPDYIDACVPSKTFE